MLVMIMSRLTCWAANGAPWFLKINPCGKVPVLDDDGTIITESAAVCMHLAEKFPERLLLPPVGTLQRTHCYIWISFILTELDAPLWTVAQHRFALPKEQRVPAVVDTAYWAFDIAVKQLAMGLGERAYLVGDAFTVADILAGHTLLWAKSSRRPLCSENLERYLALISPNAALLKDHYDQFTREVRHRVVAGSEYFDSITIPDGDGLPGDLVDRRGR